MQYIIYKFAWQYRGFIVLDVSEVKNQGLACFVLPCEGYAVEGIF